MTAKYSVETYGIWRTKYWKQENDANAKRLIHSSTVKYDDLDEKMLIEVLKDELDIPDYAVTAGNIKKEFGYTKHGLDISDECMKRIIKYYKFRESLYKKALSKFTCSMSERMLKDFGAYSIEVKFSLPPEGNSFSCDDPDYDSGQIDAWIKITMRRC